MSRHIHEWVLRPESKTASPSITNNYYSKWGSYGTSAISSIEAILDIIRSEHEPTFSSETWVCHCGDTKTNYHRHPSLYETLTKGNDMVLKDSAKDTEATSEPQSDTNLVSEGDV